MALRRARHPPSDHPSLRSRAIGRSLFEREIVVRAGSAATRQTTGGLSRAALALLAVGLGACAEPPSDLPPPSDSPTATASGEPGFDEIGLPAAFADALAAASPTTAGWGHVEARALDRSGDDWAIAEVTSDSGSFLVQWADLGAVAVEQVMGDETRAGPAGLYHPTASSPFFALLDPAETVRQSWDLGALSVMNGAFFETPGEASSQIAFPLAVGGRVVTGGSSPYGPGRPGAGGKQWGQTLRVLGLDTLARVADYDRQSGAPLGQPGFENAVVSYAPEAHPTRIATRFHVLGALDADGDGATETLIVVTSDGRTRIGAAASLLIRLGAAPDAQIALDGGASVLVWTPRAGTLHQPTPIRGRPQPLPHFLVFRPRPDA